WTAVPTRTKRRRGSSPPPPLSGMWLRRSLLHSQPHRSRVSSVERYDEGEALCIECRTITRWNRLTSLLLQGGARSALLAANEHLEVEVRTRYQPGHAHVSDGLTDGHARALLHLAREVTQVRITGDVSVRVLHVYRVTVAAVTA